MDCIGQDDNKTKQRNDKACSCAYCICDVSHNYGSYGSSYNAHNKIGRCAFSMFTYTSYGKCEMVGNIIDSHRKQRKNAPTDMTPIPNITKIMARIAPAAIYVNKRSARMNPISQLPPILPAIKSPMPTNDNQRAASRADILMCSVT